jgi:acyl carrier protein
MTRPDAGGPRDRQRLMVLVKSERPGALRRLVEEEIRAVLLMSEDETLAPDASYFEQGLTSLAAIELGERIGSRLGCPIATSVLFNQPTVEQLVDFLVRETLPGMSDEQPEPDRLEDAAWRHRAMVDDVLQRLYEA